MNLMSKLTRVVKRQRRSLAATNLKSSCQLVCVKSKVKFFVYGRLPQRQQQQQQDGRRAMTIVLRTFMFL